MPRDGDGLYRPPTQEDMKWATAFMSAKVAKEMSAKVVEEKVASGEESCGGEKGCTTLPTVRQRSEEGCQGLGEEGHHHCLLLCAQFSS